MKGVIADCLSKFVSEKFGLDKWHTILTMSDMNEKTIFPITQDIDDARVMSLVENSCKVLNISLAQAADAFGEYWVNQYATEMYNVYYNKYDNARDFIKGMDAVHATTTNTMQNAHPPRFEFEDIDDKTLLVTYKSSRNMIDFYMGLVKGVGIYFKTPLKIEKISGNQVKIIFM